MDLPDPLPYQYQLQEACVELWEHCEASSLQLHPKGFLPQP